MIALANNSAIEISTVDSVYRLLALDTCIVVLATSTNEFYISITRCTVINVDVTR